MTRFLPILALTALAFGCHTGTSADDLGGEVDLGPGGDDLGDYDAGLVLDFTTPFDFANADLATGPITVTPDPVDFGPVINKKTSTQAVTITNPGGATITIQSATTSGVGFSVDASALPVTLSAGGSTTLMVTFAPTVAGLATGVLSIAHDGSSSPAMVPLVGQGIHSVDLSWNASTSTGVTGYNVYRGTTAGGPYPMKVNATLISALAYQDIQVLGCKTYYYVATAVGSMSLESGYSNEAVAAIPCP